MKEGGEIWGVEIVCVIVANIAPENVFNGKKAIKVGNNNILIG